MALIGVSVPASSDTGGRLLATGGGTQIEGAAGGGVVPWAVIAGYGAEDEFGADATVSYATTRDLDLSVLALSVGFDNRFELSFGHQRLDVGPLDTQVRQNVFGAKMRLAGDLIYTDMPQISLGVQHKRQQDFVIPSALGARSSSGTDVYLSASKLFLAGPGGRSLLLNGTVRATNANETGLLGFGGAENDSHRLVGEASAALFLSRNTAVGIEYRQKRANLSGVDEDDWWDVFIGYFPNKNFSVIGAFVDLGSVAGLERQSGAYLSLQASF
ncbi:DUF3034 family protein [Thioalkalivibrio sp. ALJ7]|uniref:DUF3034 family protein n=1 Tax=Thioalkalivibrio sp. ALJ7 TaxID=1158756 RepID=UPI00037112AF|nr:DUF3034 family protein [Thioalkalivibrio sp. ALJ7]